MPDILSTQGSSVSLTGWNRCECEILTSFKSLGWSCSDLFRARLLAESRRRSAAAQRRMPDGLLETAVEDDEQVEDLESFPRHSVNAIPDSVSKRIVLRRRGGHEEFGDTRALYIYANVIDSTTRRHQSLHYAAFVTLRTSSFNVLKRGTPERGSPCAAGGHG